MKKNILIAASTLMLLTLVFFNFHASNDNSGSKLNLSNFKNQVSAQSGESSSGFNAIYVQVICEPAAPNGGYIACEAGNSSCTPGQAYLCH